MQDSPKSELSKSGLQNRTGAGILSRRLKARIAGPKFFTKHTVNLKTCGWLPAAGILGSMWRLILNFIKRIGVITALLVIQFREIVN